MFLELLLNSLVLIATDATDSDVIRAPSSFADWVSVIKDLFLIGAALVGGYVGLAGLRAWKIQLKGKTEFDVAKDILVSTYKLRDEIRRVRSAYLKYPAKLGLSEEELEELTEDEKQWHLRHEAYQRKIEPMINELPKLYEYRVNAEVFWGGNIEAKINPLLEVVNEICWAIEDELNDRHPRNKNPCTDAKLIDERGDILYSGGRGRRSGEFDKKVEKTISEIADFLKPKISK